jgi:hypothetical protein
LTNRSSEQVDRRLNFLNTGKKAFCSWHSRAEAAAGLVILWVLIFFASLPGMARAATIPDLNGKEYFERQTFSPRFSTNCRVLHCLFAGIIPVLTGGNVAEPWGALYILQTHENQIPETSTISRCNFLNCSANGFGGCLFYQADSPLELTYCCSWDCAATAGGHFASICNVDLNGYQIGCVRCGWRNWEDFGLNYANEENQMGAIRFLAQYGVLNHVNLTDSRAVLGSFICSGEDWTAGDMEARYITAVNNTGTTGFEAGWKNFWANLSYINFLYNEITGNLITITLGKIEHCYFYHNTIGDVTILLKNSGLTTAVLIIGNCVFETTENESYVTGNNVVGSGNAFGQSCCLTWAICHFDTLNCVAQTICLTEFFNATSHLAQTNKFFPSGPFEDTDLFSMTDGFSETAVYSVSEFTFSQTNVLSGSAELLQTFIAPTEFLAPTEEFKPTNAILSETDFFEASFVFCFSNNITQSLPLAGSSFLLPSFDLGETEEFIVSEAVFNVSEGWTASDHVFYPSMFFALTSNISFSLEVVESENFSWFSSRFGASEQFEWTERAFNVSGSFVESSVEVVTEWFNATADISLVSDMFNESENFSVSNALRASEEFNVSFIWGESFMFAESYVSNFNASEGFNETVQLEVSCNLSGSVGFLGFTEEFNQTDMVFNVTSPHTKSSVLSQSRVSTTAFFSRSFGFSRTAYFSMTSGFSITSNFESSGHAFTYSNILTRSRYHQATAPFSNSYLFSLTETFTKTQAFSYTPELFSLTDKLTLSNNLPESYFLADSNVLEETGQHEKTGHFETTHILSSTMMISESRKFFATVGFRSVVFEPTLKAFSMSILFTQTSIHVASSPFASSSLLTGSMPLDGTSVFSGTQGFTRTEALTATRGHSSTVILSPSGGIPSSATFARSNILTKSSVLDSTAVFSESLSFSGTQLFSPTVLLSKTAVLTQSLNAFVDSEVFTISDVFDSSLFSESSSFSETSMFSMSVAFSETVNLTESLEEFVDSVYFTISYVFERSSVFSESSSFSSTRGFSATSTFSRTSPLTKSADISSSRRISSSRGFGATLEHRDTTGFTDSEPLSKTPSWSKSEHFVRSVLGFRSTTKFSGSALLNSTKTLRHTYVFLQTAEINETEDHFIVTDRLQETEYFNETVKFGLSLKLMKTPSLTKTEQFTASEDFNMTVYNISQSGVMTNSMAALNSSVFSLAKATSAEGPTGSGALSSSVLFSGTDSFTETWMFERTMALRVLFVEELQSIWGYLCAIMLLMCLGTGLLVRGLVLMERLDGGLTIEDNGSEPLWHESEEEEEEEDAENEGMPKETGAEGNVGQDIGPLETTTRPEKTEKPERIKPETPTKAIDSEASEDQNQKQMESSASGSVRLDSSARFGSDDLAWTAFFVGSSSS